MKYFFLVGERSGDVHAANLAAALKQPDPGFRAQGFGGGRMRGEGIEIVCGLERLSFMGFWEVIKNLWTILQNFRIAKKAIRTFQPDVVICIDNPGFNMRMAKWCKKNGFKTAYYILPQAWAWNESRVYALRDHCDKRIGILPFEPAFYREHGIDMDYAGHPLLDEIARQPGDAVTEKAGHIALLPGSRVQELKRLLPLMLELAQRKPKENFVIAGIRQLEQYYPKFLPENVRIAWDDTYGILRSAKAAVVCSGTATLETALLGIPQVVVYKTGWINAQIVKRVAKVPFAALPNLVAGEKIVEELLQWNCTANKIDAALQAALQRDPASMYAPMNAKLGGGGASKNAARVIFSLAG